MAAASATETKEKPQVVVGQDAFHDGCLIEGSLDKAIEGDMHCSICMELPGALAAMTSKCGHTVCKICLLKRQPHFGGATICTICNAREPKWIENDYLRRRINDLRVKCCRDKCDWKGTFCKFHQHIHVECSERPRQCKHECGENVRESQYPEHEKWCLVDRLVNCKACRKKMPAKSLKAHEAKCPEFIIKCPDCPVTTRRKLMRKHGKTCPEAKIKCAKCREEIIRKNQLTHDEVCPEATLGCICGENIKRKDRVAHYKDVSKLDKHVGPLMEAETEYIKMSKELALLKEKEEKKVKAAALIDKLKKKRKRDEEKDIDRFFVPASDNEDEAVTDEDEATQSDLDFIAPEDEEEVEREAVQEVLDSFKRKMRRVKHNEGDLAFCPGNCSEPLVCRRRTTRGRLGKLYWSHEYSDTDQCWLSIDDQTEKADKLRPYE